MMLLSQENRGLRLELPDTPSLASPLHPSLLWRPYPPRVDPESPQAAPVAGEVPLCSLCP